MKRIFILAGEPSGDIHAARLMNELKKMQPDIEFLGIGGSEMTKAGLRSLIPLKEISVVGFWEVAKKYSLFRKLLETCRNVLAEERVDAFIPVDYPGFNLRLAEFAKSRDIPVIYYIAPQLWAWGKDRAKNIKNRVNKLLVVFPFEVDFFKKFQIDAEFVGHPLLDDPAFPSRFLTYEEREFRIAVLPGSRKQEIIRHLPILSNFGNDLKTRFPKIKFGIAKPASLDSSLYTELINNKPEWELWEDSRVLLKSSVAGVIKTGTSNLEAALCGTPFAMFYRTSYLSYIMSKRLINLPYISIINILSDKMVVKELIQNQSIPGNLSDEISYLITNSEKYSEMQDEFIKIRKILGESGASGRAAEIILKEI